MNEERARPRVSKGYRIGVVLAVIALVPLLGTSWFTVREALSARVELDRVGSIDERVQRLVTLSDLRTRLLDEQTWTSAELGLGQIGVSPKLVFALSGIDVPTEASEARAGVDDLVAELALTEIGDGVRGLRGTTDEPLGDIADQYGQLERRVAREADRLLDEVIADAGQISDRGELVTSLRVLESAAVARQASSAEFQRFFGAQFSSLTNAGGELEGLVEESALRRSAVERMERLVAGDSAAEAVLMTIGSSEEVAAFDEAAAAIVEDGLKGLPPDRELSDVLQDLDTLAEAFVDASRATELHVELIEAAGEDVSTATAEAAADAQQRNQLALGSLLGLVAISVAVAIGATRAIAQPIHRLASAARRIRDGQMASDLVDEAGPVEVREAARALNEAGAHLALAERQALALAEGDLEHESLSERGSGALGASLQSAVRNLAASMQEREDFRRRMTHEATHDGLTQLPNRNASLGQLQQAVARIGRADGRLAVLFVDLDGFKEVNDHHGHPAGDSVLRVAARRLANSVRAGDHVGRLGGDEFVVIAEPVADEAEAVALAEAIQEAIQRPIQLDASTVTIGASVGIAISGEGATGAGDLLRDADLAVYRAKEQGRDRVEICDEELRSTMAERADLEVAIREALLDEQFALYYQPIVDPKTGGVVGYEALIRWNRPGHGVVGPDNFIPFAERSDLIVHIDRWVVANVARQIVSWDAAGLIPDTPVSINISGRHLASPEFLNNVVGPIEAYGIDPSRIVIEITESALLEDLATAASKLQSLRQRGIRIAIDDFGTGYTSLAHLKSLPIDILKIDRSFTSDASATSLVQLIIDTGHLLGATVTAEGIETADQALALGAMGSDDLQGYLYGRPVPANQLAHDQAGTPLPAEPEPARTHPS